MVLVVFVTLQGTLQGTLSTLCFVIQGTLFWDHEFVWDLYVRCFQIFYDEVKWPAPPNQLGRFGVSRRTIQKTMLSSRRYLPRHQNTQTWNIMFYEQPTMMIPTNHVP